MSWSTIRKATETDIEKLELVAQRFAKRHGIDVIEQTATQAVEFTVTDEEANNNQYGDGTKLRRLWHKCVSRALGDGAEGIAYGYVGTHVD